MSRDFAGDSDLGFALCSWTGSLLQPFVVHKELLPLCDILFIQFPIKGQINVESSTLEHITQDARHISTEASLPGRLF